ncbi:MAG: hypothetical protein WCY67_11620 [Acidithiobacillus sp.]
MKLIFSLCFITGLISCFYTPAYGARIRTLHQLEKYSKNTPEIKEKENKILSARQEIKILQSESSPILQSRIKIGHYTHFNYDGIPRNYIAKPKIGFKYYLFGGNKYLRHITAQAQPAYYHTLAQYDALSKEVKKRIATSYISYWKHYNVMSKLAGLLRLSRHWPQPSKKLHGVLNRIRLSMYLAHMRARIALHKLSEILGRSIRTFVPIRPAVPIIKKSHIAPSILRAHPAITGLIRYYHDQRQLGWLRFMDIKFKLFVRPSYYPSAGKTKMAVIGGVYLNMPIDILGAEHHANQQLDLERENILLKLKEDNIQAKQSHQIATIRLPIYRKETHFWEARVKYWLHLIRSDHGSLCKLKNSGADLPHCIEAVRAYRSATIKWIHADARLALIQQTS